MGRCTNADRLNKLTNKTLDKNTEFLFSILEDIEICKKVNANQFTDYEGTNATYNRLQSPPDMFNCMPKGCRNTATLMVDSTERIPAGDDPVTPAIDAHASATFPVIYDATEFYAGLVTYYIYFETPGTYTIKTTMADITDEAFVNSDVFSREIMVTEAGYQPIIVDFSGIPESQTGLGWVADEKGAFIKVDVSNDTFEEFTVGFSSFSFYDTIDDMITNFVVGVGCPDEIARDITVDATDATCYGSGYDPTSPAVEITLTGKQVTPNYWLLNPLEKRGTKTEGWRRMGDNRTIQATTVDGVEYGFIQMPDMAIDIECRFITVQLYDSCNLTDSELNRVSTNTPIYLQENQYIVLDGSTTTPTDAGKILFNTHLIGQKVKVIYPRKVNVTHYVANDEDLNSRKVSLYFELERSDGKWEAYLYNDVLITSFPGTINNDETEFEFDITVQRDSNGNFYERFVIES